MIVNVMAVNTQTHKTPFERLVGLHVRLLKLQASASSEVSAAEDAASFGDAVLAEQHFSSAKLYRIQVKDVNEDVQKQFDAAPELEHLSRDIEAEARARFSTSS